MRDDLLDALNRDLKAREMKKRAQERAAWLRHMDNAPPRTKLRVNRGITVDVELQPHRWLTAGLDVLRSAHVTARVQLMNGAEGPPMNSISPYPVFQFGAELFLKGMYLCQYPNCRRVAQNSHVPVKVREDVHDKLRKLGHDLLGIIERLKRVKRYRSDSTSIHFLRRISAIIRLYYFPLHQAGRRSWADARYPKRFYDDTASTGQADSLKSYPEQQLIAELFEEMSIHLDQLWNLRRGLIGHNRSQTKAP